MKLCVVDWPLVVEFLKAVLGPVTVVVVATLAIRNFRAQKLIERRLDWYEKTYRALGRTGPLFAFEARVEPSRRDDYVQRADKAAQELAELMTEGWLYARQSGFEALQRAHEDIARILSTSKRPMPVEAADEIGDVCNILAIALAKEMRNELKAGDVSPIPGVTKTTRPDSEQ